MMVEKKEKKAVLRARAGVETHTDDGPSFTHIHMFSYSHWTVRGGELEE